MFGLMNVLLHLLVLTTPAVCWLPSLSYPALRSTTGAWGSLYSAWSPTEADCDSSVLVAEADSHLYSPPPADFHLYSSPPANPRLYSSSHAECHPALSIILPLQLAGQSTLVPLMHNVQQSCVTSAVQRG